MLEELETKLASCKSTVAKGDKDISDWKDQAADAQEQLALVKEKFESLEKDHAKAKQEIASLTRTISQTRASYKVADSEAAILRERVAEAEDALEQCQRHQATAILPKWMEDYVQITLVRAWYAVKRTLSQMQITSRKFWKQQGSPMVKTICRTTSKFVATVSTAGYEKITQIFTSALPATALDALSNIKTKMGDAWSSEAANNVRKAVYAGFRRLLKEADTVIAELEGLLCHFVKDIPALAFLTKKPFSRMTVVVLLGNCSLILPCLSV